LHVLILALHHYLYDTVKVQIRVVRKAVCKLCSNTWLSSISRRPTAFLIRTAIVCNLYGAPRLKQRTNKPFDTHFVRHVCIDDD